MGSVSGVPCDGTSGLFKFVIEAPTSVASNCANGPTVKSKGGAISALPLMQTPPSTASKLPNHFKKGGAGAETTNTKAMRSFLAAPGLSAKALKNIMDDDDENAGQIFNKENRKYTDFIQD